jgi:hypothetical protein
MLIKIVNALLWPGTFMYKRVNIDPEADAGLMRSFFNFLVYLPIGLIVVLAFV